MKRATCLLFLPLLLSLYSCSRDPKGYVDTGNKYFAKGKFKEASIMYRRALQKDMRFSDAWYHLGLTNLELRNFREARNDFIRAWDTDVRKTNPDALVKQADIDLLAYMSDRRQNKSVFDEIPDIIKQLKPDSYDALRLSGYVALYKTDRDKTRPDFKLAIQKFEQANQVKPDQPDLMLTLVQALAADNQPEQAEKYARAALAKQPKFGRMYDFLYTLYARSNRLELAEQVLKEKVANNPGQGSYVVELALHYARTNRKSDMTATLGRLTSDLKTYPNANILVGDFYTLIRDFDSAVQQYQQGIKNDPKQKVAYQKRIAELLALQNKNDQAEKVIADLLKENPKDPEAVAMHASLMLRNATPEQAKALIGQLQPLVAKTPASAILHYNLGTAYVKSLDPQNLDQARLQFEETVKLKGSFTAAKLELANIALRRNDFAKAVTASDEILKTEPNNGAAMIIRANGLMQMGQKDKAREQLTTVLKLAPGSSDARYQLGLLNLSEKKYKDAADEFEALRKANDARGLMGLIEVKVAQNDAEGALAMVRRQLQQTPDRQEYQLALANIEYRAGKWNDAAADFQKLVDKNPKSVNLYVRLGETKRYGGDNKGAIAAFQKAHEVAPNNTIPILQLAMLYDTSGRKDEARKAYEDVLKLEPDNPVALNNLAYAKADDGVDLDQALTYVQRAQQKKPNDPDIIDTLGLIYVHKNLTDDSIRLLKDLVDRWPDRSTYHLHLAMAYYQKGSKAAAKKELEFATRTKPSEKEQARIKELLVKVG